VSALERAHPSPRTLTALLFVFVTAALWVGLRAMFPYLKYEHQRMEPMHVIGMWGGNLLALFWFLQFGYVHLVLNRTPYVPGGSRRNLGRGWWLAMLTLLGALGADIAVNAFGLRDLQAAYDRAVVVPGEVKDVVRLKPIIGDKYLLDCEYRDLQGQLRQVRLVALDYRTSHKIGFPPKFPVTLAAALRGGQRAFVMDIAYDPTFPARSWIAGSGAVQPDDLHEIFGYILGVQACAVFMFLLFMVQWMELPWWYDLHKAVPVLVVALFALVFRIAEVHLDRFR
jgi:hypothetical protein